MFSSQLDGGASLFSGSGFMASQAAQAPDSSLSKNRGAPGVFSATVKQISDAYHSSDDKSSFVIDGVDATNFRLLGMVSNKVERTTDVTFTLDDGTGRIDIIRWVNEASDANETAILQNGMYVSVSGSLKGFQDKKRAVAFSIRPVTDYNEIAFHFIQCIHIHLENTRMKVGGPTQTQANPVMGTSFVTGPKEPQTPANQISGPKIMNGSEKDIYKLVLNVFQEPASLASEHGLHMDEVARRLGIPINQIKEAIDYHVDVGHIYSTIDDYHFKSAFTD
ncbi:replication protein A 32 kDa subunit A-like [Phoenix dactylifera]|uniref:Replication protein A 32 kDa subunit A-like n=1 Tax=Phoenix dactylifera TaxID=42345 RepID=A0A8B7CPE6_PHODC|nr:replication protein A 32 kDa subunit A-like [Phoenix dactylifera]